MPALTIPHAWLYPETLEEARGVQQMLAQRIITETDFQSVERLGGVDVSSSFRSPDKRIFGAVVGLSYPELAVVEHAGREVQARFPYIPGFLSFREIPALVAAIEQLERLPDLILVDGHGISHPRGIGIASHLGVLLDCPTIGVAKSILVGKPQGELGSERGDWVPLIWRGQRLGAVLRTKPKVRPVYVSTGHRISLESAIEWVLNTNKGYRLPEPTRQAHLYSNMYRRQLTLVQQQG